MARIQFPTAVAAELGDATPKMLNNWRTVGFLLPAHPGTSKRGGHRYSFNDIVAMRVIRAAEPLASHTLEPLRAMVAYVCARPGLSSTSPLPSTTLATDGRDVCELPADASLASLRKRLTPSPILILVPLDPLVNDLQAKLRALNGKHQAA